jgi:hypothetical protein
MFSSYGIIRPTVLEKVSNFNITVIELNILRLIDCTISGMILRCYVVYLPTKITVLKILLKVMRLLITSSAAKISESFVCRFFNELLNSRVNLTRYGCTVNGSTTDALTKLSDFLGVSSDCGHNFVRILFVDFSKAFALVEHNILLRKFLENDLSPHVVVWFLSFLNERYQYVKLEKS